MRARRISATIAIASILTAACGSGSPDTPTADPAPPAAAAPDSNQATQEPTPDSGADTDAADTDAADTGGADVDESPTADEPPAADEPASDDGAGQDVATEQPEPDSEPVGDTTAMARPDDGCSADNSPTPASAADGPLPVVEVRAESVDSPLPDLAVRRINCNGGWVNLRNELPSDQPLLVWFWAPH